MYIRILSCEINDSKIPQFVIINIAKQIIQKLNINSQIMSETTEDFDSERERVIRFVKFAAFILALVIGWYVLDIADGV